MLTRPHATPDLDDERTERTCYCGAGVIGAPVHAASCPMSEPRDEREWDDTDPDEAMDEEASDE